jgi:outer membrane protein assembly factor BamE (lipoprotein component of BamABCDE complex)
LGRFGPARIADGVLPLLQHRTHDVPARQMNEAKPQFSIRHLLVATAAVAVAVWAVDTNPIARLLGEATYYSSGYSRIAWIRLDVGMTEKQVTDLLGEPLRKFDEGTNNEHWEYTSCSGPSEIYYLRKLYFKNGIVTRKLSDLYVD